MYLDIIEVNPLEDYKLLLKFENNEQRVFDVKPYFVKSIFKELVDKNIFSTVKVVLGAVEWSNKADIDPRLLYEESVPYVE